MVFFICTKKGNVDFLAALRLQLYLCSAISIPLFSEVSAVSFFFYLTIALHWVFSFSCIFLRLH